jgi:hypothetical protein
MTLFCGSLHNFRDGLCRTLRLLEWDFGILLVSVHGIHLENSGCLQSICLDLQVMMCKSG